MMSLEEIQKVKNHGKKKRLLKEYKKEQKRQLMQKISEEKQTLKADKPKKTKNKSKMRVVTIDGVKYMKNRDTGKLYGMPRTITTRKIARNRMRNLMKAQGVTKINKNLASFWASPECRRIAKGEVA